MLHHCCSRTNRQVILFLFLITTVLHSWICFGSSIQFPLGSSWKNNGTTLAAVPGEEDGVYRVIYGSGQLDFTFGFIATLPPDYTKFTFSVVALQNYTSRNRRFVQGTASVVWSANRDNLVTEGATLTLGMDGNLQLYDGNGRLVWASNTTRKGVRALQLASNGNLALIDAADRSVWQTFDWPTEVLLPGQNLSVGFSLVSSVSASTPSSGNFSLVVEPDGVYMYASSQVGGRQPYVSPGSGGRRGVLRFFNSINGTKYLLDGSDCFSLVRITVSYTQNSSLTLRESWNLTSCNIPRAVFNTSNLLSLDTFGSPFGACNPPLIGCYLKLDPDGDIRQYQPRVPLTGMSWGSVGGDLLSALVNSSTCYLPNECGPYGVCSDGACRCPGSSSSSSDSFFRYIDPSAPELGCSRSVPLDTCTSNMSSSSMSMMLLEEDNVGYFAIGSSRFSGRRDRNVSLELCKEACLQDCTCGALFFTGKAPGLLGSDSGETLCYYTPDLPYGLKNMSSAGNATMLLRAYFKVHVQPPQPPQVGASGMAPSSSGHSVTKLAGVISSGVFVLLVLIFVFALYLFHKRRLKHYKASKKEMLLTALSGLPPKLSYKELKSATGSFARKLGTGELGPVFEAVLLDGSKVAVKQLELGPLVQKDFRGQVVTLARIQHYNLVRLRGFCAEGAHLLLVYELIPNGSLDSWLFWRPHEVAAVLDEVDSTAGEQQHKVVSQQQATKVPPTLPWNVRFNICLGIARGLLHLHEGCTEQVLHLSLKPQSILLDANLTPKISGFGLSKLKRQEMSQVGSRRVNRESRGYQAPEWLLHAPASAEMDVYSFGMILLEIISGRRNLDIAYGSEQAFFPSWACEQVELGRQMELVDAQLEGLFDAEQAEKLINIALWCIQEVPKLRPRMRFVVEMLEGQEKIPRAPSSLHVALQNTGELFSELGAGFSMQKLGLANFDQNSDAYERELELSDVELLMSRERSDD